jgi:hypothetical protein
MAVLIQFHSNYEIEICRRNVRDGVVKIGDKEWVVDEARPFTLKKPFGEEPVYFLNWKSLVPMDFEEDFKVYETEITPEMLKRIVELKIFTFLLRRFKTEQAVGNIWNILLGIIGGAIITYALIAFKIIPI